MPPAQAPMLNTGEESQEREEESRTYCKDVKEEAVYTGRRPTWIECCVLVHMRETEKDRTYLDSPQARGKKGS